MVATLNHAPRGAFEKPNHTAYQRFLQTGPIAFLPLSPTVSSLFWSTKPCHASALCKSDPAVLSSMINAAFRLPDVSIRYLHDRILEADTAGETLSHDAIIMRLCSERDPTTFQSILHMPLRRLPSQVASLQTMQIPFCRSSVRFKPVQSLVSPSDIVTQKRTWARVLVTAPSL